MKTTLNAKAEALQAINTAKHKAAGRTHRAEIKVFGPQGGCQRTAVFYTTGTPDVGRLAIKAGTRSISASFESAIISAL